MGEVRERMLRGERYITDDPENEAQFGGVQELLARFNGSAPGRGTSVTRCSAGCCRTLARASSCGQLFYCEYGAIGIGDRTFVNVDAVMLDVAAITIGAACQIAISESGRSPGPILGHSLSQAPLRRRFSRAPDAPRGRRRWVRTGYAWAPRARAYTRLAFTCHAEREPTPRPQRPQDRERHGRRASAPSGRVALQSRRPSAHQR
jgi:hypothetical protein